MPGIVVDGRDNEGGRSPEKYDGDRIERGREIEEGRRGRRFRDGWEHHEIEGARDITTETASPVRGRAG
jgi:hypothetical protein